MTQLEQLASEAALKALPAQSGFHVGAALEGENGVYQGWNIEVLNAPIQVVLHAEMAALLAARRAGERKLKRLAVTASPCGICRQILFEWCPDLEICFPDRIVSVRQLLPFSFSLGQSQSPLTSRHQFSCSSSEDPLEQAALEALQASWTPLTRSPFGVALQDRKGEIFVGSTIENSAYTSTISAVMSAVAHWSCSQRLDVVSACGVGCLTPFDESSLFMTVVNALWPKASIYKVQSRVKSEDFIKMH